MSLIYGENCYGKSTLCDILRSLAENTSVYITDRMAVPPVDGGRQHVQVSFVLPGQDQETSLIFQQGAWNPTLPDALRVEVFDTDFIHRNIFTGLTIQRENRENITRFVLGGSGVRTAQRISEINSEIRALNKGLREAEANVFTDIGDLPTFLALDVTDDLPTIERSIAEQLATLETERCLAQDLETARVRPEPTVCSGPPALEVVIARVEESLAATFERAHQDAESRLTDHLENHTQDPQQARNWAQQGRALMRDDNCPFCGRRIEGTAADLIAAYQEVFNDAYDRYVSETMGTLDAAKRELADASVADLRLRIEKNQRACLQYPELRSRGDVRLYFESADETSAELIRQCEEWVGTYKSLKVSLAVAVQHKRERVHTAVPPWGAASVVEQLHALSRAVDAYNHSLRPIVSAIADFKNGLNAEQVAIRVQNTQRDLERLRLEKRRIESDVVCRNYSAASSRKRELESQVEGLQDELAREQTEFLTRYFATINRIFASLGSRRFTIAPEPSRRGNMPTVHLNVSFKGEPITQNRLRAFFSESDRRALAFAVFWARLETREADDRACTIVVLDDPVTSFDDGRIDRTIRLIESQFNQLRQVIILSHYSAYIEAFFNRLHGQHDGLLLATLYQDTNGTHMRRANPLDFVETDHQRAYRRIATFIEREHVDDVFSDLRVFLETEVRSRYYRSVSTNNLRGQQFAALLDELERVGAMPHDTRQAVEPLRLTLNTDHHIWTDRSLEEKIGIAEDVLRFVYEEL